MGDEQTQDEARDEAQALYIAGNHGMARGDLAGAEACFARTLELQPWHAAARANLGYLKELAGAPAEAEFHYRQAIALMPEHAQLQRNLGALLWKARRLAEAEDVMRAAVALAPDSLAGWSQLGVLLACMQREVEAEQCYRSALALADAGQYADSDASADLARLRFNLSYLLLRQGRLDEGWPLLESRWQFQRLPEWFACPRWQGEPLAGKALVITLEAGQGDMIQFCRYAALAKSRGAARIAVVCHPPLKTLFQTLTGIDAVYASDEALPVDGWDFWTTPMSMPRLFGTAMDNLPAPIPYLAADPALIQYWQARLPAARLRVGLAWKGNPQHENDADRSLPSLHTLAPLIASAARAGIALVSLQKGPGEDEAEQVPALLALGPQLRDFADTAAVIASLDLVIAVDSAVAHLAGALGKPCWLLLPDYRCDWRWFTERQDTPWYPATRLFRQPRHGGWAPVIAAVAAALPL